MKKFFGFVGKTIGVAIFVAGLMMIYTLVTYYSEKLFHIGVNFESFLSVFYYWCTFVCVTALFSTPSFIMKHPLPKAINTFIANIFGLIIADRLVSSVSLNGKALMIFILYFAVIRMIQLPKEIKNYNLKKTIPKNKATL